MEKHFKLLVLTTIFLLSSLGKNPSLMGCDSPEAPKKPVRRDRCSSPVHKRPRITELPPSLESVPEDLFPTISSFLDIKSRVAWGSVSHFYKGYLENTYPEIIKHTNPVGHYGHYHFDGFYKNGKKKWIHNKDPLYLDWAFQIHSVSFGKNTCLVKKNGQAICRKYAYPHPTEVYEKTRQITQGVRHTCHLNKKHKATCTEVGASSPFIRVSNIKEMHSGLFHQCFLKKNNSLVCHGNSHGASIVPPEIRHSRSHKTVGTGDLHTCVLQNKRAYCFGENLYEQVEVPLFLQRKIKKLSVGSVYNCALTNNGLSCWGHRNSYTPMPVNHIGGPIEAISTGSYPCTLQKIPNHKQRVQCWGQHSFATPWTLETKEKIHHIKADREHHCIYYASGRVQCFHKDKEVFFNLEDLK